MTKNFGHGYKARVFITGISGFVGSELAKKLLDDGYEVGGMLRWSPRVASNANPLKGRAKLYVGDLRDFSTTSWIMQEFTPDYVFHLGAISPVSYSFDHPQESNDVNYMGTINLVEACRKFVPNLKKFVFASTMEVYGRQDPKRGAFTEKTLVHPHSPYAVAKYAAERYLCYLYHAYKYPIIIARGSNTFGRENDTYFVTEAIITQMLANPDHIELGNKDPIRSYIHIKDKVDFYQSLMETDDPRLFGEVFNTGPSNGLSVESLANKIQFLMRWKGEIKWNTRELRAGEIFYLNTSGEKIKKMTGWEPKLTLREGLSLDINFWRNKIKK